MVLNLRCRVAVLHRVEQEVVVCLSREGPLALLVPLEERVEHLGVAMPSCLLELLEFGF